MTDNKIGRKRPNQYVLYASAETEAVLQSVDGPRSDYINKAIQLYDEYQSNRPIFLLQRAYDYFKYMPEAEALCNEMRKILWRQPNTPTSVIARSLRKDNTYKVEEFTDAKKAQILLMADPDCLKFEIYDRKKNVIAMASRTERDSFVFELLAEEAM